MTWRKSDLEQRCAGDSILYLAPWYNTGMYFEPTHKAHRTYTTFCSRRVVVIQSSGSPFCAPLILRMASVVRKPHLNPRLLFLFVEWHHGLGYPVVRSWVSCALILPKWIPVTCNAFAAATARTPSAVTALLFRRPMSTTALMIGARFRCWTGCLLQSHTRTHARARLHARASLAAYCTFS